jgi:hypothetical protein
MDHVVTLKAMPCLLTGVRSANANHEFCRQNHQPLSHTTEGNMTFYGTVNAFSSSSAMSARGCYWIRTMLDSRIRTIGWAEP